MAYYLRIVKARDFSDRDAWLSPNDIPDNAVRHFRSDEDDLSLYYFERVDDVSRIVAAFAAADRERVKSRDAVYISADSLDFGNASVTQTDGELLDREVSGWHRSVSGLNEEVSRSLAFAFGTRGVCCQFSRGEVCELIAQAVATGLIAESALSDGVARDVVKHRQRLGQ